jgi:hypothetical protein
MKALGNIATAGVWRGWRVGAPKSVAQDHAVAAVGAQAVAECLGLGAAVASDLGVVERATHAGAAAAGVADRLAGEHRRMAVAEPRHLALGAGAVAVEGDDDAPGHQLRRRAELAQRAVGGMGDAGLAEAGVPGQRQVELGRRRVAPGLGAQAGDRLHVGAGLGRQPAPGGDEALGARLAAVIGHGGQADIAVVAAELGQVEPGGLERLGGVEGVPQAAQLCRARHELGDALGAGRADRGGVEQAFLPQEPGEEAGIERIVARHLLDGAADVGDVGVERDAAASVRGAAPLGARRGRGGGGTGRPGRRPRDRREHDGFAGRRRRLRPSRRLYGGHLGACRRREREEQGHEAGAGMVSHGRTLADRRRPLHRPGRRSLPMLNRAPQPGYQTRRGSSGARR